jgi:hypothetical protein
MRQPSTLSSYTKPTRRKRRPSAKRDRVKTTRATLHAKNLLGALCPFACAPEGVTNGRLRPVVAQLLGVPAGAYTARQMGYDLRRLVRKGLLGRVPGRLCYSLTPLSRRVALFLTKVHARVLRPGLQGLDTHIIAQAPPLLRTLFIALDAATDSLIAEARLVA